MDKKISYFKKIKKDCNGMLSPLVYKKIYDTTKEVKDGVIVEVGTAHGASSVSIATAIKDENKNKTISFFSIEKAVGGSREKYGGINENTEIIRKNFEQYNVSQIIKLLIGDVESVYKKIPDDKKIELLVLDADGAIDRDFRIFFNRMQKGSMIIVDDYEDFVKIKKEGLFKLKIDLKHKLTYLLVNYFIEIGLVEKNDQVFNTIWLKKINDGFVDFDKLRLEKIYKKLTFNNGYTPFRFFIFRVFRKIKKEFKLFKNYFK